MKVFTLVVELGRRKGDGLPKGATGRGWSAMPRQTTNPRPCERPWRS